MTTPYSLRVDDPEEIGRVDVMAAYLPEPETAIVDADGVVRDGDGNTFDRRTYSIVERHERELEADGGRQLDPEPHGYERHPDDETQPLADPIKVRYQGDSRVKWETRTLEPESADGHTRADLARRANGRQRTQIVIVTRGELASCWGSLQKHQEFCGKWGAHWGSTQKRNAALRVLEEINTAAADQGIDVDELDDSVTAFDEREVSEQ